MPLSPKEIDQHIRQWRPMVAGMARKFQKQFAAHQDFDDTLAIGMIALWDAARTFDETFGAKFQTWARKRVLYCYLSEVDRLKTSNRRIAYLSRQSLDATREDGTPLFTPSSEWRTPEQELAHARTVQVITSAVSSLAQSRHRKVLALRYHRDKTTVEIGNQMGFSRQRADQLENEAFRLLRPKLLAAGVCGPMESGL